MAMKGYVTLVVSDMFDIIRPFGSRQTGQRTSSIVRGAASLVDYDMFNTIRGFGGRWTGQRVSAIVRGSASLLRKKIRRK